MADNVGNMYLGQVTPQLFYQLVNAVGTSNSWGEVAARAGFSQEEIFMIEARAGSAMERSKSLFVKWRMRMPTMHDVAVVMTTEPQIYDAVDALRQFEPQLLAGLQLGGHPDSADQQQHFQSSDSPNVTTIAGEMRPPSPPPSPPPQPPQPPPQPPQPPQPPSPDGAGAGGPQQTCPPQVVLKGLTAISFNADQVVSLPQRGVTMGVEVRGNFCRVRHLNVRPQPDGSTASAVQAQIARLQELRHPGLVCLMGSRLLPLPEENVLSLDLFLPAYSRTLAEALRDEAYARRLKMPTRAGQLGSVMSTLDYLHSQQPPLSLPAKGGGPPLCCQSLSLDAFGRPIICSLELLEEGTADGDDEEKFARDFAQLFDLSVELVTGRLRHEEAQEFQRYRRELVPQFMRLQRGHKNELLKFEEKCEAGFIDSRLVVDDEDDPMASILDIAWRALRLTSAVAQGKQAPGAATRCFAQLAIRGV